jgi:hypothetical protein
VCVSQDDEDETGRTPLRRVPARHVLRLSQVGRFDHVGSVQHDTYSDGGSGADRGEDLRSQPSV